MLVGKALWAHHHKKAHMICELSPYSCMPNTMSIGAMAAVIGKHPDLLYAPLEIKGDAEVHALSRCQMILTEAKKRAQREYDEVLERIGLDAATAARRASTPDDAQGHLPGAALRRRRHGGQLRAASAPERPLMLIVGLDVGSTTVKAAVCRGRRRCAGRTTSGTTRSRPRWCSSSSAASRPSAASRAGRDRIFLTGSGAGLLAPLVGGKMVQEVVAVAAAVEKLHPTSTSSPRSAART